MRIRGKGLNKEIWFSICSRHQEYDESRKMCNAGTWKNATKYRINSIIYDLFPSIWQWYTNKCFKTKK